MGKRKEPCVLKGLDLAEATARQGGARERALAFAQVALEAARAGDAPRMARCLGTAQCERRGLKLIDQVRVLDILARAAVISDAPGFARVLSEYAADCARRVRGRTDRAEARALCNALEASLVGAGGAELRLVSNQSREERILRDGARSNREFMLFCA